MDNIINSQNLIYVTIDQLMAVMETMVRKVVTEVVDKKLTDEHGIWEIKTNEQLEAMFGRCMATIRRNIKNGVYGDAVRVIGNAIYVNEKMLWKS